MRVSVGNKSAFECIPKNTRSKAPGPSLALSLYLLCMRIAVFLYIFAWRSCSLACRAISHKGCGRRSTRAPHARGRLNFWSPKLQPPTLRHHGLMAKHTNTSGRTISGGPLLPCPDFMLSSILTSPRLHEVCFPAKGGVRLAGSANDFT